MRHAHGVLTSLLDTAREVGAAGVVDILLMALLIYAGLAWLRRSQTTKVVQGILVTGLLYLVARQFNLFLTTAVLEGFFAVALLALIVIFRDELRRVFERVARWRPAGRFGRKKPEAPVASAVVEALSRTLADLARDRVGALVVLKGEESLEVHLDGGVRLNGEPSEALLKSLFDAHSIGHDGAVVIERDLVTRFGCHLPLSTRFDQLGTHGTRHAAALGLAERSDALCVVVSEERGTISVAQGGELRPLDDPSNLRPILEAFISEPLEPARSLRELVRSNYRTKAAALGLSVLLWLVLVYGAKHTTRNMRLPVEVVEAPEGLTVSVEPAEVTVTFGGPRRNFLLVGRGAARVTIGAGNAVAGSSVRAITVSDVSYPKDLTLREIRPPRVRISLQAPVDPAPATR